MATVTHLPGNRAEITDDTGSTYIVPAEVAARDYPEAYNSPAPVTRPEPQQELPPWELPQMPQPEMNFTEAEAGFAPEPEMNFSPEEVGFVNDGLNVDGTQKYPEGAPPTIDEQIGRGPAEARGMGPQAPQMAPQPQSQSVSRSRSVSGTGPYQEARHSGAPTPPPIADLEFAAAQAYQEKIAALGGVQDAVTARDAGLKEQYAAQAAQRLETAQKSAEMHEAGMRAVAESEERLAQRIEDAQKMDMNKVWKDTPAMAKFAGIMSAGIAGYLNPTGKNSVVEQMMRITDQSAKEQAANMAQERFQIGQQRDAIGRMGARSEASRGMYLESRAALEANIIDQISLEESKYSSAITLANLHSQKAAFLEQFGKTTKEIRDTNYAQGMQKWKYEADLKESRANRAARAAQFRMAESGRNARAQASTGSGPLPPQFQKGDPLFVDDKGRTVYAKHGLARSDTAIKEFDQAVSIGRQLADDAKSLALAVHKYKRAIKFAEPEDVAVIEFELNNLIEDMRPKVGANLPTDEAVRVEAQFGAPGTILKRSEVTTKLINQQIKRQGGIVDQRLGQWGSTIGEPVVGQDGRGIVAPDGKSWLERQIKYKRGEEGLKDLFGNEFQGLDLSAAMESEATSSLNEMEELSNQLEETTGSAQRADLESRIASSAAGLLDYVISQGLTDKQNSALFTRVDEHVDKIRPEAFQQELIRRDITPLPTGVPPSKAFSMASDVEESGKRLADVLKDERNKHGAVGAGVRMENGDGPLSRDEWAKASKWIEEND